MYLIDAHEDLAYNVLSFSRDYTRAAAETREREQAARSFAVQANGDTLLGWPDYQEARAAVVFSTLFAAPARRRMGEWDTQCYQDADEARRIYSAQLDVYDRMVEEHPGKFSLLKTRGEMQALVNRWERGDTALPVGLVVLMEGAEGVREPAELEEWWARGVRLIGPAWAGTRFCGGTGEPGPLTTEGYALLDGMADYGFVLDISHMDSLAARQALDHYDGRVVATHANAAALLKGVDSNRHLPDENIHALLERNGVIGVVPYNAFLQAGWKKGGRKESVTLEALVAQIDYICQLAGNARHVGLGSDFDGGFGLQHVPAEIDTIADLHKIADPLRGKGYSDEDIAGILGRNWYRLLDEALPQTA